MECGNLSHLRHGADRRGGRGGAGDGCRLGAEGIEGVHEDGAVEIADLGATEYGGEKRQVRDGAGEGAAGVAVRTAAQVDGAVLGMQHSNSLAQARSSANFHRRGPAGMFRSVHL